MACVGRRAKEARLLPKEGSGPIESLMGRVSRSVRSRCAALTSTAHCNFPRNTGRRVVEDFRPWETHAETSCRLSPATLHSCILHQFGNLHVFLTSVQGSVCQAVSRRRMFAAQPWEGSWCGQERWSLAPRRLRRHLGAAGKACAASEWVSLDHHPFHRARLNPSTAHCRHAYRLGAPSHSSPSPRFPAPLCSNRALVPSPPRSLAPRQRILADNRGVQTTLSQRGVLINALTRRRVDDDNAKYAQNLQRIPVIVVCWAYVNCSVGWCRSRVVRPTTRKQSVVVGRIWAAPERVRQSCVRCMYVRGDRSPAWPVSRHIARCTCAAPGRSKASHGARVGAAVVLAAAAGRPSDRPTDRGTAWSRARPPVRRPPASASPGWPAARTHDRASERPAVRPTDRTISVTPARPIIRAAGRPIDRPTTCQRARPPARSPT